MSLIFSFSVFNAHASNGFTITERKEYLEGDFVNWSATLSPNRVFEWKGAYLPYPNEICSAHSGHYAIPLEPKKYKEMFTSISASAEMMKVFKNKETYLEKNIGDFSIKVETKDHYKIRRVESSSDPGFKKAKDIVLKYTHELIKDKRSHFSSLLFEKARLKGHHLSITLKNSGASAMKLNLRVLANRVYFFNGKEKSFVKPSKDYPSDLVLKKEKSYKLLFDYPKGLKAKDTLYFDLYHFYSRQNPKKYFRALLCQEVQSV